jgi:hypothetical protein
VVAAGGNGARAVRVKLYGLDDLDDDQVLAAVTSSGHDQRR